MTEINLAVPPRGTGPFIVYTWSTGAAAFASTEALITTSESTSSTTYTDLTTVGPSVTITVPSSGNVRVSLYALVGLPGGASGGGRMSVALSGANTLAASDANSMWNWANGGGGQGSSQPNSQYVMLFTGLTPGSTTFTAKYMTPTGNTTSFSSRRLAVYPVGVDQG